MIHRKSIVVSNNFKALFVNDFKSFLTFGFDIKEIRGFGAEKKFQILNCSSWMGAEVNNTLEINITKCPKSVQSPNKVQN